MIYLKYFENKDHDNLQFIESEKLNIAKTIYNYYKAFVKNVNIINIEDLIIELTWNYQDNDQYDDLVWDYNPNTDQIDVTIANICLLIETVVGNNNIRDINTILELYNNIKDIDISDKEADYTDKLKEIFLDYSDIGEVKIRRDIKRNFNGTTGKTTNAISYVIKIDCKEIFLKIDFIEVLGRIGEYTKLYKHSIKGSNDFIRIEIS